MKAYFIQFINDVMNDTRLLVSGAIIAENKEEAVDKGLKIAEQYRTVKELRASLYLYTLIELTEDKPAQFRTEVTEKL